MKLSTEIILQHKSMMASKQLKLCLLRMFSALSERMNKDSVVTFPIALLRKYLSWVNAEVIWYPIYVTFFIAVPLQILPAQSSVCKWAIQSAKEQECHIILVKEIS